MENIYEQMGVAELKREIAGLEKQVQRICDKHLSLDMARGKPSQEQIDLSRPMLDLLSSSTDLEKAGGAAGNYGFPDGLPLARKLAADLLGVEAANVVVSGSASLHLMYDLVCHGYVHGVGGHQAWCRQGEIAWLCPAPGYDRHFRVTESFGIHNIPVAMGPDGPDMDEIERLVESDPHIKGIWCVPKYSNPTGVTYTDEVVRRFAALRPAAPDFRIYWDNAYIIHDLYDEGDELLNIFSVLAEMGRSDFVYEFASTSKVTFPGSGIAWVAASSKDMAEIRSMLAVEQVGPEKMTQLAHVLFFSDLDAVRAHMRKHAAILRPRFELVESKLTTGLGALGIASWSHPRGGYFVSFEGPRGSARSIVSLMGELGVRMTNAGATWPGGNDPRDTNIRVAPTYPSQRELSSALDVFVVVVRLVAARLALAARS